MNGRTVESHVCRLRHRLADAGATDLVHNSWARLDPASSGRKD